MLIQRQQQSDREMHTTAFTHFTEVSPLQNSWSGLFCCWKWFAIVSVRCHSPHDDMGSFAGERIGDLCGVFPMSSLHRGQLAAPAKWYEMGAHDGRMRTIPDSIHVAAILLLHHHHRFFLLFFHLFMFHFITLLLPSVPGCTLYVQAKTSTTTRPLQRRMWKQLEMNLAFWRYGSIHFFSFSAFCFIWFVIYFLRLPFARRENACRWTLLGWSGEVNSRKWKNCLGFCGFRCKNLRLPHNSSDGRDNKADKVITLLLCLNPDGTIRGHMLCLLSRYSWINWIGNCKFPLSTHVARVLGKKEKKRRNRTFDSILLHRVAMRRLT